MQLSTCLTLLLSVCDARSAVMLTVMSVCLSVCVRAYSSSAVLQSDLAGAGRHGSGWRVVHCRH